MPDPKKYESEDEWMSACVPTMVDEGKPQKQAVAACLNMWRNKEKMGQEGLWGNGFAIFKDTNGQHRWLAIYSNKFRDRDNPPEILASTAHADFVDAVDKGEWPYPELWLWHVRGTRSGAADWVAYDDSGFSLASGTFDEGKEHVAEFLSQQEDLRTSHGMPVGEIQRDKEDSSIITRYRSIEISPLPGGAAANPYTGFAILKEVEMALPKHKKPFLEGALGEEAVEELEQTLADGAKELEEARIESKEEAAEPIEEEVVEEEEAPVEESKEEVESAEAAQYVTHDELEEVFAGYVKPLVDQLRSALDHAASQDEEIKALQAQVKELQRDDEAKLKETLQVTPAASLFSRIGSVIGSEETAVDGRTSLAKSAPAETAAPVNGPTLVPGLNEYMARQRGG